MDLAPGAGRSVREALATLSPGLTPRTSPYCPCSASWENMKGAKNVFRRRSRHCPEPEAEPPADRAPHAPPGVPLRAVAVGGARSPKHLAQVRCPGAGENVPLSHSVYPHVRTFKTHKRSHKQTLPFLFF